MPFSQDIDIDVDKEVVFFWVRQLDFRLGSEKFKGRDYVIYFRIKVYWIAKPSRFCSLYFIVSFTLFFSSLILLLTLRSDDFFFLLSSSSLQVLFYKKLRL